MKRDANAQAAGNAAKADYTAEMEREYPVIPLRDQILFPGIAMPLLVGRAASMLALEQARLSQDMLLVVLQKDSDQDDPGAEHLFSVGICVRVQSVAMLPNGLSKVLVSGLAPVRLEAIQSRKDCLYATARCIAMDLTISEKELQKQMQATRDLFGSFAEIAGDVPAEFLTHLATLQHPLEFYYALAPFLRCSLEQKQEILECSTVDGVADLVNSLLYTFLQTNETKHKVEHTVRHRMQQNQREWLLNEQIRVLQEELGHGGEGSSGDYALLDKRIREKKLPPAVEEKVREELDRLPMLHQSAPEYAVVRNYIDWFLALPFNEYTQDCLQIKRVAAELDKNHYGLEKVKERTLEHVAVLKLSKDKQTPILCLVGPPGVGKTSLASSIAAALNRNYFRITLGGVRDESEIRGHRRTYIGSMPGRFIQALRRAKSMNPLILLDEIDKMSSDFRGDPASALLEVLDPEQNHEFIDHFMEVGVDLSRVLFLATANVESDIPLPLRDRMEVVRLTGYRTEEKLHIAIKHLLPRVCQRNGLELGNQIALDTQVLENIVREHTREAGVRELERCIDRVCRKRAREIVEKKKYQTAIQPTDLGKYLGVPPFTRGLLAEKSRPGLITGLAWTSLGGEILQIECTLLSGKGRMVLTGTLGDVMKESAQIALTLVRERARRFGVDPDIFRRTDIHIHIPEGAIPKDGPSAGIGLTLALLSAFTRQMVAPQVAFTGEVSLTGRLHAIGGLPEKSMAALEAGVSTLYLAEENRKNVAELPLSVRKGLKICHTSHIDEIIGALFKPVKVEKKTPNTNTKK